MKNTNKFLIIFSILIYILFTKYNVDAASLDFSSTSESYNVGDTINVKVYVGADSKSVNAISAKIKFSNDVLTLSSVSKNGSIVNIWAEEPVFSNSEGSVSFEGVILNGFTGDNGNAITLIFKAKANGVANLSFDTASVLANDGKGTDILYNKGISSFVVSGVSQNNLPVNKNTNKDMSISISEVINTTSKYSPNKFIITSKKKVIDNSYSIQIDSNPIIIWTDDGTHIFQSPALTNGVHTIKVKAIDIDSNTLSGSLNFSTSILKIPSLTYYPKEIYTNQILVIKGEADPVVDIELTIKNNKTGDMFVDHLVTNSDGKFTYVSDENIPAGEYNIVVRAMSPNGIYTDYMNPVHIISRENKFNYYISIFGNYISLMMPLILLLSVSIFILIVLIFYLRKFHLYINRKISNAKKVVSDNFTILDSDVDKEIEIFKKIISNKTLSKEEHVFLVKFKKDIDEAERVIKKELDEDNINS